MVAKKVIARSPAVVKPAVTVGNKSGGKFWAESTLMYSTPKCGKTTLAFLIPDRTPMGGKTVRVMTENGAKAFATTRYTLVRDYASAKKALERVGDNDFCVIDTLDELWQFVTKEVERVNRAPFTEIRWGKGYDDARRLWHDLLAPLTLRPCGCLWLGHETSKQITVGDDTFEAFGIALNKHAKGYVETAADNIIRMVREGQKRTIVTRDDANAAVGCRVAHWPASFEIKLEDCHQLFA